MANHLTPVRIAEVYGVVFELVADHGYTAVRTEQIAKAAHMSTATLYRHWGSKSALVVDVLASGSAAEPDPPDTGSLMSDLHASVDHRADHLPSAMRFLASIALAARDDEQLAQAYQEHGVPVIEASVDDIVARAVARGEIDKNATVLPHLTALMLAPWTTGLLLDDPVQADHAHVFIDTIIAPLVAHGAR